MKRQKKSNLPVGRGRDWRAMERTNPPKHMEVVALLAEGAGIRRTATAAGVSICAVKHIKAQCEADGRIPMLRQRLAALTGRAAEEAVCQYYDALLAGQVKPHSLPVHAGILFDKYQVLSDAPTSIVAIRKEISPEAIRAGLDKLLEGFPSAKPEPAGELPESANGAQDGCDRTGHRTVSNEPSMEPDSPSPS